MSNDDPKIVTEQAVYGDSGAPELLALRDEGPPASREGTPENGPEGTWATSASRYLRLSLFWFAISLFWAMMLSQVMQVTVERFFDAYHKGTAFAEISILGAFASAGIQLVVGPLSDRCLSKWGRRRPFLFFGAIGGSLAIMAFGSASTFPIVIVTFLLIQVCLNVATGPYQAFIPDLTPRDHQGRASAFMGLMQLLGEAGGPILAGIVLAQAASAHHAGFLADHGVTSIAGGVRFLLVVDTIVIAALAAVTLLTVPDPPALPMVDPIPLNPFKNLRPRENANFLRLLLSRTAYNMGFYVALDFLSYYVRDSLHQGDTPARFRTTTLIMLVSTVAALIGTFPAGYLADRVPKKRVVYFSCAFSALAGLAFALAPSATFAIAMGAFFGLGFGVFRAVDWAFACNLLPKQGGVARWMAIWSLSQLIPQVLAPGFGPVADHLNRSLGLGMGWRAAMLVCMLFVMLGAVLISFVKETTPLANGASRVSAS